MQHLHNDTAVNVAGLLKGQTGEVREYEVSLDRFPLDDELVAEAVSGLVRLTRLRDGVMASATANGTVILECARCLRLYPQPFDVEFSEEYRQTVDVRTGLGIEGEADEDDDTSHIDDNHLLDIGDVLRQEIVLALPMRADCGEECPGPDPIAPAAVGDDMDVDDRLAALASLLDNQDRAR